MSKSIHRAAYIPNLKIYLNSWASIAKYDDDQPLAKIYKKTRIVRLFIKAIPCSITQITQ